MPKILHIFLLTVLLVFFFNTTNAQMNIVWEQQTNAYSSYNSRAEKIAFDSEENIIIAGYSWYGIYNSNQTVFIAKLSPAGEIIWLQRFMGEGVGDYDNGTVNGLFIDHEDNILLFAKYFSQKAIKYDKDGNLISADDYTFDLPFTINVYNNDFLFHEVHKDAGGYFHIGGTAYDNGTTYSYYAQFNPQLVLWVTNIQSIFSNSFDFSHSLLSYYDSYKIYLVGGCVQGANSSNRIGGIFLSSMTTGGVVEWSTPNWYSDYNRQPIKMLRSNDGTTYLATFYETSSGNERGGYLQKLGSDGSSLWEVPVENMFITDIEFDKGGNIWLTGQASNSYPDGNATLVAKYSRAGETLVYQINEDHYWNGQLIVDDNNDIYLIEINNDGVFVVKQNWNGDKLDEVKVSSNWNSVPTILTLDSHNDLITCFDYNEKTFITKITDNATVIEKDDLPEQFSLSQNYPNPFNPTTKIRFSIPSSKYVSLKVINTLGEVVSELVSQNRIAGKHEIDFNASELPSGIYFYRLEAGDFSETKKMILIK